MEMRRKDLAVTDPAKKMPSFRAVIASVWPFADGTHPYIVPLSFGYVREGTRQSSISTVQRMVGRWT